MKRIALNVVAGALIVVAFAACGGGSGSSGGKGSGGGKSGKIKMTTERDHVHFYLSGNGVATVDWGDGTEKMSRTLNERDHVSFEYFYPSATIRTVTINGDHITELVCNDENLTSLDVSKNVELVKLICYGNQLTSVDVSKNIALTELDCYKNQLTSLDVSKNAALTLLSIAKNHLSAAALNALFSTLHNNTVPPSPRFNRAKVLGIDDNPGCSNCDRSIAERKGWTL